MATSDMRAIVPDTLLRPQEITRESLVALIEVAEKLNMEIPWWENMGSQHSTASLPFREGRD